MNKHTFKAAVFKKKGLPQHYTFYFFIAGKIKIAPLHLLWGLSLFILPYFMRGEYHRDINSEA